jgi:hypothetical protein
MSRGWKNRDGINPTQVGTPTAELVSNPRVVDMLDLPPIPVGQNRGRKYNKKWKPSWLHPQSGLNQCDHMIKVLAEGGHISRVCIELGISEQTFYDWCKKHESFKDAYAIGRQYSAAFYEELMLKGSAGLIEGFNAHSVKFILGAKLGWNVPDANKGNTVVVENMNVLDTKGLTEEQLQEKIDKATKKLQKLEMKDAK